MFFPGSGIIAQEKVLFDQTVTWEWPIPQWYGGNSFYWWHRPQEGVGVTNFGDMSSTDWESPANFRNGIFYMRFEVFSQPTDNPFRIQLGIWQDITKDGGHSETISESVYLDGGSGSVIEAGIGSPSSWWQIRTDVPVDFSRPEDFYRIGIVLWKGDCVPKGQGWGDGCPDYQSEFFPMQARITVVAVPQGSYFSGWSNYNGGSNMPAGSESHIKSSLSLFPNPTSGEIIIHLEDRPEENDLLLVVQNISGSLVYTERLYFSGAPVTKVQLNLIPGFYIVNLIRGNRIMKEKILIH